MTNFLTSLLTSFLTSFLTKRFAFGLRGLVKSWLARESTSWCIHSTLKALAPGTPLHLPHTLIAPVRCGCVFAAFGFILASG